MAATNKNKTGGHSALNALTAAALILPGLVQAPAQAAADDEFSFQYGRYQEGERDLGGVKSNFKPITVDSLQGSGNVSLTDRIKFGFNFIQDTWSGATPITTAPSVRQGNQQYSQFGTIAGASPYIQTGDGNIVYFDSNLNPLKSYLDQDTGEQTSLGRDQQLVHTMVMASPETRKEGNFKLSYEWDEAAVSAGGGLSSENDYESRFTNLGLRLDFNQKRTTLDFGASYSNAYTSALLDHDASNYINQVAYLGQIVNEYPSGDLMRMIKGNREDWGGTMNLTQVVNKDALAKLGVGFTHSAGYLENPYKVVTAFFVEPIGGAVGELSSTIPYVGQVKAFAEQRPNNRNQVNLSAGWVQYVSPLDASLHLDYKFFHDDWGIDAHTFEGDWVQPLGAGWTITPRVRYYSQSAADFYYPYLIARGTTNSDNSNPADNAKLPTQTFSSDHRLSGYGALSGGLMISKQFAKGLRLDAGFEYYTHKGSWRLDGQGEGAYADFDYYVANAALNVNLTQLGRSLSEGGHEHHHHHQHGAALPAGVMFGHMMEQADSIMVGYRYMYGRQDGAMLHGEQKVSDQSIVAQGCTDSAVTCRTAPTYMDMHMHMLDLMYAPTDWLNLMLMPQFMDMNMNVRGLAGVSPAANIIADHLHGGHQTGGIGDTGMYALFKLLNGGGQHVNLTLGVSAPTGDVGIRLKPRMHQMDGGFIHYGMQLGSGTWDFKPALTYTGKLDDWSWGAQVSGTKRIDNHNESGYVLGDMLQTTAWGSYNVLNWLAASVRGIYTTQGSVKGGFYSIPGDCSLNHGMSATPCSDVNPKEGSMDQPGNYGGRFWDVGLGLNATVPDGSFAGNNLSVEWLQPVMDDVNGYQLDRYGTLNATWTYMF